jgi:hypothetical protein
MAAHTTLHQLSSRLDRVFELSRNIEDDEIKSHYARYLCVLTSGYLEESFKLIIRTYVGNKSHPNISNYVNLSTNNVTSLKTKRLAELLCLFNIQWQQVFESLVTEEEKEAVDSVVANRHLIAHGQNVGVSYARVLAWYKDVKNVVEKISTLVNS